MDEPRRPILGVSTKMYFSLARTREYVDALVRRFADDEKKAGTSILDRVDVFVAPDFVALPAVVNQLKSVPRLQAAAQDCAADDYGAFTGFVSPAVLADLGVRIVEVGHAERRRLLAETDDITAAKAAACARNGLAPLVCVGETHKPLDESHTAASIATIIAQITPVFAAVPDDVPILLAYEPVWAIGAAHPASAAYVRSVVAGVRASEPVRRRGPPSRTRILYGGSAGPGLFSQLAGVVDGLFLGRFGHDPNSFLQTAQELAEHAP